MRNLKLHEKRSKFALFATKMNLLLLLEVAFVNVVK